MYDYLKGDFSPYVFYSAYKSALANVRNKQTKNHQENKHTPQKSAEEYRNKNHKLFLNENLPTETTSMRIFNIFRIV